MKYLKSLFMVAGIYLLIQGLGLWVTVGGFGVEEPMEERIIEHPEMQIIENPEDPYSSLQIFVYVIVSTALLLLLIKFKLDKMIKLFINLGILMGLYITLSSFIGDIAILPALSLVILRFWRKENLVLMNVVIILTIPGIGSLLGAQLGFQASLILLIILAVYDIVAVFGTKHMVTLAESARGNIPLMVAIPVGDRNLGLGTGDLAIPLVFSISVLGEYTLENSVFTIFGGCLGLIALVIYTTQKKDIVLPALPPITAGLLLGLGLSFLIL